MKSFKQMIQSGDIKRADAMKITLDELHVEPGFNLREEGEAFLQELEPLVTYISEGGIVPALEVRPREEGGVWVVDGHRRRQAMLLARERGTPIEWVNIVAFQGNDADRIARVLTSQEGAKLSQFEVSKGYKRLHGLGYSSEEIAAKVHKSRAYVDQLLTLANANTDVQRLVQQGAVPAAVAIKQVKEKGDKAGKFLTESVDKAAKQGRTKITDKDIKTPIKWWKVTPTAGWYVNIEGEDRYITHVDEGEETYSPYFGPIPEKK